ncbi:MAG: hypothetical protein RMH75_06945 [Archaeoglobaceae archaeon]|nr:hypothetical protein [Archaeoglobaceae archaeon]
MPLVKGSLKKKELLMDAVKALDKSNKVLFVKNKPIFQEKDIDVWVAKINTYVKTELSPKIFLIENGVFLIDYFEKFMEKIQGFVMHVFSEFLTDDILDLAKRTNSEIIYFPRVFLKFMENKIYREYYRERIEKNGAYKTPEGWKLIEELNFDNEIDYYKPKIEPIAIRGFENLKSNLQNIYRLYRNLISDKNVSEQLKLFIKYVVEVMRSWIARFLPPDFSTKFDPRKGFQVEEFEYVIHLFKRYLDEERNSEVYAKLKELFNEFRRLYHNLKNVKHPQKGEKLNNSKYMTFLELLKNREQEKKYYIFSKYDSKETIRKNIEAYLGKGSLDKIVIWDDTELKDVTPGSFLVLSTPPPPKSLHVLSLPFEKIFVLFYEGIEDLEDLKNIERMELVSFKKAVDFFQRVCNLRETESPKIFLEILEDLIKKHGLAQYIKDSSGIEITSKSRTEYVRAKYSLALQKREVKKYRITLKSIKSSICEEELKLEGVYYLPILRISSSNYLEEVTLAELKEKDIVCLIEGDSRKQLIDLISEFIVEDIDLDFIRYWKVKLKEYILDKNLTLDRFYDIYTNYRKEDSKKYATIKNWVLGRLIGPKDQKDLETIAKIIGDEFLEKNCDKIYVEMEKIRNAHKVIGKKIYKIIKSLLTSDFSSISSLDEDLLLNKIKLYEVVAIEIFE